jgi:hypothetical protein
MKSVLGALNEFIDNYASCMYDLVHMPICNKALKFSLWCIWIWYTWNYEIPQYTYHFISKVWAHRISQICRYWMRVEQKNDSKIRVIFLFIYLSRVQTPSHPLSILCCDPAIICLRTVFQSISIIKLLPAILRMFQHTFMITLAGTISCLIWVIQWFTVLINPLLHHTHHLLITLLSVI